MRTIAAAVVTLAAMTAIAQAEPCRNGTNMPITDALPGRTTDPNAPLMVCETGSLKVMNAEGKHIGDTRTWSFSLRDRDGNRVDNAGRRLTQ